MRTNVVVDDALINEAMRCTGLTTKRAVIHEALKTLVALRAKKTYEHCAAGCIGRET